MPVLVQAMAWCWTGDKLDCYQCWPRSLCGIFLHWASVIWASLPNTVLCHFTLLWRHNGHEGISNHQPHDCLLNRLFGRRSKNTSKLRVTDLCAGNRGLVNSPHKWPVTRKMFPFDDVIMKSLWPSDTIWGHRSGSTMPLPEPMLIYHQ